MTIQDLIDELKRHDPHLPVCIGGREVEFVREDTSSGKRKLEVLTDKPVQFFND